VGLGHTALVSEATPLTYGQLANWFHLLTPPGDYAEEAAEVLELLEARVDPLETALELGSGGGILASHLTPRLQLTLTDPADGMLEISRTINPDAAHVQGDMRTLDLGRTFDAVIVHDAVVYMVREADLHAAMETAWRHLRPGGVAVLMPDWVSDEYQPRTEHGGSDEGDRGLRYLEWDRGIEADGHTVKTDYIIVTRDRSEVQVHHDGHTLGIFSRATWLRLLGEVGFDPLRVDGGQGWTSSWVSHPEAEALPWNGTSGLPAGPPHGHERRLAGSSEARIPAAG
jgi:SAM-dependent methyltransferase